MPDASSSSLIELATHAAERVNALESMLKNSEVNPSDLESTSVELLQLSLTLVTHLQAVGEFSHHGQLFKAYRTLGKLVSDADLNISS